MGTKGITFVFDETSPNWMPNVSACKYFVDFYTRCRNKDLVKNGGSITIWDFFEGLAGYRPYLLPSLADKFGWEVGDKIEVRIIPRKTLKGNTALEITTVNAKPLTVQSLKVWINEGFGLPWEVIKYCDTDIAASEAALHNFRRRNGKELALKWHHLANVEIKKVIFNDPATIVFWDDGSKTVVKCKPGETFSEAAGLALCYMKKCKGNKFHKQLKKWLPKEDKK